MTEKDTVYAHPLKAREPFKFDEKVADVFDDMIRRSVPGYDLLLDIIGLLTQRYALPHTHYYDLGCSLGASTLQMRNYLPYSSGKIIAIDNSEAMVKRCASNVAEDKKEVEVEIRQENIQDSTIENASIVNLNFTLQFIADDQRSALLGRIAQGLVSGGILILSEKICFDDTSTQQLMTNLHEGFKKLKGYSDLEISQKRSALENVLVPNTLSTHFDRLKKAGFSRSCLCVQCFNFISILAIK